MIDCPRSAGEVLGRCAQWPNTQDEQGAKKLAITLFQGEIASLDHRKGSPYGFCKHTGSQPQGQTLSGFY